MAQQYSVTIYNKSSHSDYLMVYQNDPTSWDPNALSIAWFSKFSNPNPEGLARVTFRWDVEWGFSWAETGSLEDGVIYEASELYVPNGGKNKISLDYNGAFFFTNPSVGDDADRLYLQESGRIPVVNNGSVGVTMGGNTVYATPARPNQNLTFSPKPSYYLAYGNFEEGQVLDVSTINNPLRLDYPTGVYSLTTTLNADDSWDDPVSLMQMNQRRIAMRQHQAA